MKIMGIDPGLAKMGWGIIESEGKEAVLVDFGCISTSKKRSFSDRLGLLYEKTAELVRIHRPAEVAIEKIFFASNTKTAIDVAQARGAIIASVYQSSVRVMEYTPLQIKQALVGYGRAQKGQVQFMVKNFLKLNEIPQPDHAADALAAALCHSNSRKMNRMIK